MGLTDLVLPIWVKPLLIGLVVAGLYGGGLYTGLRMGKSDLLDYKLEQERKANETTTMWQGVVNGAVKNYERKLAGINSTLGVALNSLRDRPGRVQPTAPRVDCKGSTGTELSREDAEFLTREAARADTFREGLSSCYEVIDGLKGN